MAQNTKNAPTPASAPAPVASAPTIAYPEKPYEEQLVYQKGGEVAIIVPYAHSGNQKDQGRPIVLVPIAQIGPVADPIKYCRHLYKEQIVAWETKHKTEYPEWFYFGRVTINGAEYACYGLQGSRTISSSQKAIVSYFGDAIKRASKEDATDLLRQKAQSSLDKLIAEFVAKRPDCAGLTRAELVARLME